MPRRFINLSREQPAKAIVIVVTFITIAMSVFAMTPWYGPPEAMTFVQAPTGPVYLVLGLFNVAMVYGVSGWLLWAAKVNSTKHLARSTFWMFMIWLLSGLNRVVLIVFPGQMLWVPFVLVAIILSICYLYFSALRRGARVND